VKKWRKRATYKRNWSLLIENMMTEKCEEERDNGNGSHGQLTLDDMDAKKTTTTTKCNLTEV